MILFIINLMCSLSLLLSLFIIPYYLFLIYICLQMCSIGYVEYPYGSFLVIRHYGVIVIIIVLVYNLSHIF